METNISSVTIPDWVADLTTGIEMLYRGIPLNHAQFISSEETSMHNMYAGELGIDEVTIYHDNIGDPKWAIPDSYLNLDVIEWVLQRTPDDPICQTRAAEELSMYSARNLLPILQLMIYMVEKMRELGVVWGVGRGSSVSSYVLYLIGVHRVDPIIYDLSITEFLK